MISFLLLHFLASGLGEGEFSPLEEVFEIYTNLCVKTKFPGVTIRARKAVFDVGLGLRERKARAWSDRFRPPRDVAGQVEFESKL